MKIGLFISDFDKLENWEILIIDRIFRDSSVALSIVLKDSTNGNITSVQKSSSNQSGGLGKFLYKIQRKIELKLFKTSVSPKKKKGIIESLNKLPLFTIDAQNKLNDLKAYNLDIILKSKFSPVQTNIQKTAKNGIWSFLHGDTTIKKGGSTIFSEITNKVLVSKISLIQQSIENDSIIELDNGFHNTNWSMIINEREVQGSSTELFFKNIRRLQNNSLVQKPLNTIDTTFKWPSSISVIKYMFRFYYQLFTASILRKILYKFFGKKHECWTLFIGQGDFENADLASLTAVNLPKDEFWADPFIYKKNGEVYVFFENYPYKIGRGKLSCGRISGKQIVDVVEVMDREYHLSYPFIFEEENILYMIPETGGAKRLEIYKCTRFPDKWELYTTAFEGEAIVDTTYYKDDNGDRWLFLNKGYNNYSNLFIYKIDSLKMEKIEEHTMNPVIIDARIARGAGAIYKKDNNLIRPSQCNSKGVYGYGLNLNHIKKLTLNEYEEERILAVEPNFKKRLIATHHLHQVDDMFVIDGCYKRK